METNQVRYFLALCEEKNFTRAAKRCGVSQPSVSNAIKRLEEELGGDLFRRTKNGAKLSSLGMAIRPYLHQINECAEGARREAACNSTAEVLIPAISTADMVSISAQAKFARRIFSGIGIAACALFVGVLFGRQMATRASTTVDVAALETTIDIRHLPSQALPSEVYQ
jgi:Bacterial regulatory helix-turn-helix protein, lysR family